MSDKTKYIRDNALIDRRFREQLARQKERDASFLCACGAIPTWVETDKRGRVKLYCEACRVRAGLKV